MKRARNCKYVCKKKIFSSINFLKRQITENKQLYSIDEFIIYIGKIYMTTKRMGHKARGIFFKVPTFLP